jgi:hypothetical protein
LKRRHIFSYNRTTIRSAKPKLAIGISMAAQASMA